MFKVTRDRSYREIEVISSDDDAELTEAQAREFAQAYLYNESDSLDWDYDDIERVNGQRVIVKFAGW